MEVGRDETFRSKGLKIYLRFEICTHVIFQKNILPSFISFEHSYFFTNVVFSMASGFFNLKT